MENIPQTNTQGENNYLEIEAVIGYKGKKKINRK